MWTVAYEGENNPTDFQVKADDAYTGETAFHFWSEDSVLELYAITNGEEQMVPFMVTTFADWKNPVISEIKVAEGTLTIGVRMKCNAKSWGTVDEFILNRISD